MTDMKKSKKIFLLALMQLMLTAPMFAQKDVIKFYGIPVDGDKSEVIAQLKAMGLESLPEDEDAVTGTFNDELVYITTVTNSKNKVWRIVLMDATGLDEADIKTRFNTIYNSHTAAEETYINTLDPGSWFGIPDDVDVSDEILLKNRSIESYFYQLPDGFDNEAFQEELVQFLLQKMTKEQLASSSEEVTKIAIDKTNEYLKGKSFSNSRYWFQIMHVSGKYCLIQYYDNLYNMPEELKK